MKANRSERGSALMLVTIIVLILVGISAAYMSISSWNQKRAFTDESGLKALYVAESAAAAYINDVNALAGGVPAPVTVTQHMAGGTFIIPVDDVTQDQKGNVLRRDQLFFTPTQLGDPNYAKFQVQATVNGVTRRLDVLLSRLGGGAFWNVIYAGNKRPEDGYSDPDYTLEFGNSTKDPKGIKDVVRGPVYSGGNVKATGTAELWDADQKSGGEVTYKNKDMSDPTIFPAPNMKNGVQPELEMKRVDPSNGLVDKNKVSSWEQNAFDSRNQPNFVNPNNNTKYIDVKNELSTKGTANHKWADGSTATDLMDPNNPAHIFRMNPSSTGGSPNRTATYEYSKDTTQIFDSTKQSRNDFYLEDPTSKNVTQTSLTSDHPVNGDTTASMINIQPNGNEAVYFLDGNLRVSGEPIKSYQLNPDPAIKDVKMNIVVKGNVSLTDNILYPKWMSETDAVAIIAIVDPEFPNVQPTDFMTSTGLPMTPNGVPMDTFIAEYNTRAAQARKNNLTFPDLEITTVAGRERAAQEYNKIYGSGNIFFGDPGSGTVEHFESYMFAENNFYTTNLDTTQASGGTQKIEIYGNMTAGNHVKMPRNQAAGYVPLNVTFDPLIQAGGGPPDLPKPLVTSDGKWSIAAWKQPAGSKKTKIVP